MPQAQKIERAELREISWSESGEVQDGPAESTVAVQFNPASMKLGYANQKAGGDQRGGSAIQYVGKGTTKLSLELLFDVTGELRSGQEADDVRKLTSKVVRFMTPSPSGEEDKFVPPGVRFVWGSFLFDGVMDSLNETLDYFSSDGRPLRSTIAVEISQQEIQFRFNPDFKGPGTRPQTPARQGDSVQQMTARQGRQDQWKDRASANGIENPRGIGPGDSLTF
jgi:hypothetical protein